MKYITSVLSLKKNCVEKLTIKKLLVPARISVIHLFTRAGYLATGYPASGFSQGPNIRQPPVHKGRIYSNRIPGLRLCKRAGYPASCCSQGPDIWHPAVHKGRISSRRISGQYKILSIPAISLGVQYRYAKLQ